MVMKKQSKLHHYAIYRIVRGLHASTPIREAAREVASRMKQKWGDLSRIQRRYIIAHVIQTLSECEAEYYKAMFPGVKRSALKSKAYFWNEKGKTPNKQVIIQK